MKKYQNDFSLSFPILLDEDLKKPKVKKALSILNDFGALENSNGVAVDIGCSAGFFVTALAPFSAAIGLDIDHHALCEANNIQKRDGDIARPVFLQGDSSKLPFSDNSIDLIICNHTYEHVPDSDILFQEIKRVLKVGGVCYFGAASRLTLIEPHYRLPFLSWLSKPLAHKYMQLTGRGNEYYENLRTYWGIRSLTKGFHFSDYTIKVLEEPDRFYARDMIPKGGIIDRIPKFIWKLFYPFLPSYIFILKKNV